MNWCRNTHGFKEGVGAIVYFFFCLLKRLEQFPCVVCEPSLVKMSEYFSKP